MATTDDAPPSALRRSPSWLTNQAGIYAHRLVNEAFSSANARRYHYSVLAALTEFGPVSQAALGRHCHLDRSDIAGVVGELADAGLIAREPDPRDQRRNIVTITPAGGRQLGRLDALVSQVNDEFLAPLNKAERERLVSLVGRVVEHHAGLQGTGWA